jgi:transposase-like protein
VRKVVKCPYCGYEGEFKPLKTWKFRFYEVKRLECPKCHRVFNHYQGLSPAGKMSEFVIRVKPRVRGG